MERTTIIQKCGWLRSCLALAVFSCLGGCGGALWSDLLQPRVSDGDISPAACFSTCSLGGEGVTDASMRLSAFATIEKVFETLEAADTSKANALEVNFTADGWPSTSSVDPRADTSDDEYNLTISEVRPL